MRPTNKPLTIGIIGGSGTGKTHVGRYMSDYFGCPFIEADLIGREVIEKPVIIDRLVDAFGKEILMTAGVIDRKVLGSKVFGDRQALAVLNGIMHPEMYRTIKKRLQLCDSPIAVFEAAVMIEAGFLPLVDLMVYVTCDRPVRVERLISKRGIDAEKAQAMLASGRDDYEDYAQIVMDTSYGLETIQKEVDIMMDTIRGEL